MNILCINTAFSEAQIAIKYNGQSYFEKLDANSKHSENLLVTIEKKFNNIIEKENLKLNSNEILKNLDYISVVVGPGSFTGLRIAIATVKAILITNSRTKAISINTLELIANEYANEKRIKDNISPVIDALSGLYFIAEFDKNLNLITQPKMIEEKDLKNYKNLVSNDENITKNFVELTPDILLALTKRKISQNKIINEKDLVPLYIRPSQAEAELCRKYKK